LLLAVASEPDGSLLAIRFFGIVSHRSAEDVLSISLLIAYYEARTGHPHDESWISHYLAEVPARTRRQDVRNCVFEIAVGHVMCRAGSKSPWQSPMLSQFAASHFSAPINFDDRPQPVRIPIRPFYSLSSLIEKPDFIPYICAITWIRRE
jgi:hypothetical protein